MHGWLHAPYLARSRRAWHAPAEVITPKSALPARSRLFEIIKLGVGHEEPINCIISVKYLVRFNFFTALFSLVVAHAHNFPFKGLESSNSFLSQVSFKD